MIENRPVATLLSHLVLILGVLIVAFPVYITFIASTQTSEQTSHETFALNCPEKSLGRFLGAVTSASSTTAFS